MKIEGEHQFAGISREQVWKLLTDPAILQRCMPGCEKLHPISENEFGVEIQAGVASIKGRYAGRIRLEDQVSPSHFKITIEGKGTPGFMKGSGVFDFQEGDGIVRAIYSGDVQIGGTIASVGQRMLQGVAKLMIAHLFNALEVEACALKNSADASAEATPPKHGIIRDMFHNIRK